MIGFITSLTELEPSTPPLESEIASGTQKQLGHFGGYVRKVAQRSLRYRTKSAAPGEPPSAHRSKRFTRLKTSKKLGTHRQELSPLRELITYSLARTPLGTFGRVIIGPMIFARSRVGGGLVPRVLELGGAARFSSDDEVKTGQFPRHPYMVPAFRRSLGRFTASLAGSMGR